MLQRLSVVFAVTALVLVSTVPAVAEESKPFGGFQEVVLSVQDVEPWKTFFTDVAGWDLRHESPVDPGLVKHWGLPDHISVTEALMANAGTETGFVRLVSITGVERPVIRSNDQSWDTGGIFNFNMRVKDMASAQEELEAIGFQASSDPTEFTFGPFRVKEWIVRGRDGVRFALIERIEPVLEGWPNLNKFSRAFNSTQVVSDIEGTLAFYRDLLGMEIYLENVGASAEEGPNVLSLPYNLTTQIPRTVYILHPDGLNDGSVEILSFDGAIGRDFSERAVPPNRGILGLRFPVSDWDGFLNLLSEKEIPIVAGPTALELKPYGKVNIVAIQSPEGAWLEFFSTSSEQ